MSSQQTNQSVRNPPAFFYGYIVAITAAFTLMLMFGTLYSFGVFFQPLSTEFGWTKAATAGAFSLRMLLCTFLAITVGRLNDRFGPRLLLTGGGLVLGLGYILMAQISAIWQFYLFYGLLIAIGMSSGYIPLISTVARWFTRRRGLMTGLVVSGIGVGILVTPPIANWLITNHGWRNSYQVIGITALVLIVLAAQFLRRDPSQVGQLPYGEGETSEDRRDLAVRDFTLREAIRTKQFWILSAMYFCFALPQSAIMVHIFTHATELGVATTSAANILALVGGLTFAGRILMGSAADRIGNKPSLIIAFILMLASLLWLQVAEKAWMLYLFAIIFGFAYGGFVSLESPTVAELFGLRAHGTIFGVVDFICSIGGALGPVLAGYIFDITGSYNQAFWLFAVTTILGLLLTWLLKPMKTGEAELPT